MGGFDFSGFVRYAQLSPFKEVRLKTVSVEFGGQTLTAEVSDETHEFLRVGAELRNRPVAFFLSRVMAKYGEFTEASINRFMDEVWIL
jgi:hypothetical protein